jgi:hypothetical protein
MRKLIVFALLLLVTGVQAQPEAVNVERSRNLEGLWKTSVPAGFSIGFSGPAKFGPMRDLYCRITQDGDIHCLSGGYAENGTAGLDGDKAHFAWGSMMARMAVDATYTDGGFTGTFTFKLSGIRHDAPEPSVGARITAPTGSDEGSKYLAALMTQLSAGKVSSPVDVKGIAAHDGALPTDVKKLGNVEAIALLGRTPLKIDRPDGDFYSVHIVEFAHGERLCGVHQNGDGVLDAFRCV